MLESWYFDRLRTPIPDVTDLCQGKMRITGTMCSVRPVETKWGSFKRETRNICFYVELAKKHTECLEHLIVPAMTHLIETSPSPRFKQLRDKNLSDSQARLDQVNGVPLGHQHWCRP